jgi:hypothetical protein
MTSKFGFIPEIFEKDKIEIRNDFNSGNFNNGKTIIDKNRQPVNEEWETDSDNEDEGPAIQYARFKVDSCKKVIYGLNEISRYKLRKYKKFDRDYLKLIPEWRRYLNENVFPQLFTINDEENNDLKKIGLGDSNYFVNKKPEIGSSLIFEINNNQNPQKNKLNFVGVSKDYYEISSKVLKRSLIVSKQIQKKREDELNGHMNEVKKSKKKKRKKKTEPDNIRKIKSNLQQQNPQKHIKKRRKKTWKKNSTIKEIKKITDCIA